VTGLSDEALRRLAALPEEPDFAATRYRLLGELDRGGMGVVYAARDEALGREVAIKVLRAELLRADAGDRLEREARVMASLEHPGIVPVHDTGLLPDGRAFHVMKRVRGQRLDALASSLSLAEALRLFARICEPVAFAHAHGVVHRDLKPENVMVGPFGEVLVLDWGVAKVLARDESPRPDRQGDSVRASAGSDLTADGDVVGTRGYMAPEQERGEQGAIGPRSDVWALGAILRHLAGGACAREGRALPRPLQAIVGRATAVAPEDRYASASDLAADVVRFADGEPVAAYREPPWERALRWARHNRTAVAVVLAYLVMRVLVWAWSGR
jgi:serine/threonine protein kinase